MSFSEEEMEYLIRGQSPPSDIDTRIASAAIGTVVEEPRARPPDEHARYLGVLKLLEECSPYVPEELRERIEIAMEDAVEASGGALRSRRILNRIEIEVVR